MVENFKFFALAYLNDWWQYDSRFVTCLSPVYSRDVRLRCLREAATYYQVIRNLRKIQEEDRDEDRLSNALDALDRASNTLTKENVDSTVESLAKKLNSVYRGGETVSAASKFLWIRHKTPVVIFDSRADCTLGALGGRYPAGYAGYRSEWLKQFEQREEVMRSACAELARVSDFSPDNETDEHLRSTIASRWFHERVFDKFLWWNGETSSAAVAKRSAAKQRKSAKDLKARGKALGIYDEVDQKAEQEAQAKYEQWQAEQESVRNERSDSPEVGANHDDPS